MQTNKQKKMIIFYLQQYTAFYEFGTIALGDVSALLSYDNRKPGNEFPSARGTMRLPYGTYQEAVMDYRNIIQKSLDYIEENLKTEITAEELAKQAGFSLFHYYRIFLQFTGMPVMQYIVRRRLAHGIYAVQQGCKMIEAALDYGFDTHAGFYKAFQREYDCSPSEYLRRAPARPPQRINLWQEAQSMITHAKLKEILSNWEVPQPVTVQDIFMSANKIKAEDMWNINDRFTLKTFSNQGSLSRHLILSNTTRNAGLEAACPLPTLSGTNYVQEGELYFILFPQLSGNRLESGSCFTGDYKITGRYLGECIGQLHQILAGCDEDLPLNESQLYEDVLQWALPAAREQMAQHNCPLPESFYEDYTRTFGELAKNLPRQLIHRNICPSNFIMTDGTLTGFADFELSERNVRLFDPCYCATGILSENIAENNPEKLEKWPEIFINILAGYDSVCKLTPEERKAALYVVYSIQMICVAYFGKLDKFDELAGINRQMLTLIYEMREKLQ